MSRCISTTKHGHSCRAFAVNDSRFCQAHDPALTAKRLAWRKAGGKAQKIPEGFPIPLISVIDVREGLAAVIGSTWKQANTHQRSRALCSLYLAALKTFEVGELQMRVEALESRIGEWENG